MALTLPSDLDDRAAPSCCAAAESPHEQRRKHILRAAEACFARSGFHGASMQEICAEAQMSPGGLYRYFRSKDEIIGAIADEENVRNAEMLARLDRDEGPIAEKLSGLAMRHLDSMRRPGAVALMAEVMAEGLRNSSICEKFMRNEAVARDAIRGYLEARRAAGEIDPTAEIEPAMAFVCALLDGLALRSAFEPDLTTDRIEPMFRAVLVALFRPTDAVEAAETVTP